MPSTLAARIDAALRRHGYPRDTGSGERNILCIEGMNPDGTANDNTPNHFNDLRVLLVYDGGVPRIEKAWEGTSEPGWLYTFNPINRKGAARIALGYQRYLRVGKHRPNSPTGHEAMVQVKDVTVYRDANKDFLRAGDLTDTGLFGINWHGGYDNPIDDIRGASAGCVVGRTMEGHREFMRLIKSDPRYLNDNEFIFGATVLSAADVLAGAAPATVLQPAVASADQRRRMAAAILDFEARRVDGKLAVYKLPPDDGGGNFEVAGINDRYHPAQANKLKALIEQGRHAEAEASVIEYIAAYTDLVTTWCPDIGVQFYLRDCAFNRGPTGAARILQRALGGDVAEDGIVGPITRRAAAEIVPEQLLTRLWRARESYERNPVGRDESSRFWRGLAKRWDKGRAIASKFSAEAPAPTQQPTPAPAGDPANPVIDPWALIGAALIKLLGGKPMTTTPTTRPTLDVAQLVQLIEAIARIAPVLVQLAPHLARLAPTLGPLLALLAAQPAAASIELPPAEPRLSPVDKMLGGQATVGLKTPIGMLGMLATYLLQKGGLFTGATLTPEVGEMAFGTFTTLAGLGLVGKFDRAIAIVRLLARIARAVAPALAAIPTTAPTVTPVALPPAQQ